MLWRFDENSLGLDSPNRMDESAWLTNPYALPNKTPNSQGTAYAYAGGSVIGSAGKKIEESDFDFNFIDLSANALPQSTMDSYVTNQGDTLQNIALGRWGDASLWYLIANENNAVDINNKPAAPTSQLKAGQSLKMPWVVSAANKSDTFRPYNPTKVIGSTTPDLPAPPPPPKPDGCGVVGSIIMIVVMVVATIFTAGAATVAMSAGLQGLMATGVSGIMSAGMAALAPAALASMGAGALALGAVSSAAGSIASQAVGVALGMQDEINWKGVGKAALSGAITAGIGASGIGQAVQKTQFIQSVGEYSKMAATALSTMATSTISQGLMSATGVSSFSWRNVAAAGIATPISQSLSVEGSGFAAKFLNNLTSSTVNRVAQIAVHGRGKIDMAGIATNAFGDALGNSLAREISLSGSSGVS